MFKRAFYSTLALLLAAPALAKVEAVDGYVRLLPPGSPNTAAFMVLKNDGDKPVALTAVASPDAGRAELHTHLHENGVMKMRLNVGAADSDSRTAVSVGAVANFLRKPAKCMKCQHIDFIRIINRVCNPDITVADIIGNFLGKTSLHGRSGIKCDRTDKDVFCLPYR